MNSLRNKLIASVVMLAVAAVMLTSASFAWYTVATQGEVARVNVQLEAVDNLEIAAASSEPGEVALGNAGNQQTWGSKVAFMGDAEFATLSQLATYDGVNKKFKTVDYDDSGRILGSLVEVDTVLTPATYTTTGATPAKKGVAGATDACVAVYDFWIRTNNANAVVTLENNGSVFSGSPASMKVVFTDASGEKLGEWYRAVSPSTTVTADSFTIPMGSGTIDENANYKVAHVFVNVFADGNQVNADSVDSLTSGNLPKFEGKIKLSLTIPAGS